MSQEFDLKFDEYKQNDPSQPVDGSQDKYPASQYARDVCFVLSDGRMVSISYNYLIAKECTVAGDQIKLAFTKHEVTLKGHSLKPLFLELIMQIPRFIRCTAERYNAIQDGANVVVNEILVVDLA
jgi:hypothetical protein